MAMIRVGDRIINTDAIAHINLQGVMYKGFSNPIKREGVKITMRSIQREDVSENICVSVADVLFFEGEEAEAVRWWFESRGVDVMEHYRLAKN